MFNTKPVYLKLVRERTNESIYIVMTDALMTIKKYDEKQQFMNMLGQDTFWKKNRLDLWAVLKSQQTDLNAMPTDALIIYSSFVNTPQMLREIKQSLQNQFETMIQQRRKPNTTNWTADDRNSIYSNGERHYVERAVRTNLDDFYIRNDDIEAFDRELNKLISKYMVKDPLRLKNGYQRFKQSSVSRRYVERVFGFSRGKDVGYW